MGNIHVAPTSSSGTSTAVASGYVSVTRSVELTRPADTPGAYSAKDAISNSTSAPAMLEFTSMAQVSGGTGVIRHATLLVNDAAFINAQIRLHLYSGSITPINDHAGLTILYANNAKYIGYIDFVTSTETTGTGTAAYAETRDINKNYFCDATSVFGMLEALAATPAPSSGMKISVNLFTDQNKS